MSVVRSYSIVRARLLERVQFWRIPSCYGGLDQMSKFHFEIVDGYTIEDPKGMEVPTERQAKKIAEEMAKQLANDVEDEPFKDVVVKSETGKVVHKAPIKSDST